LFSPFISGATPKIDEWLLLLFLLLSVLPRSLLRKSSDAAREAAAAVEGEYEFAERTRDRRGECVFRAFATARALLLYSTKVAVVIGR